MSTLVLRFVKDQSGATAIEYGLIAAGIAVVIIATVQALGTNLNNTFSTVSTALKSERIIRADLKSPATMPGFLCFGYAAATDTFQALAAGTPHNQHP